MSYEKSLHKSCVVFRYFDCANLQHCSPFSKSMANRHNNRLGVRGLSSSSFWESNISYQGGKIMTKLFAKILSLTLALLMLVGCAGTPATESADPLEGTITVEPFDAEKLGAEMKSSAYGCYGVRYEANLFGKTGNMLDYAVFGTVLETELVTVKKPETAQKYLYLSDSKYVRYKIKVEDVVCDPDGQLRTGQTITLFHPYQTKSVDESYEVWVPYYLEGNVTYAFTFMKPPQYEFHYDVNTFESYSTDLYNEYIGEDRKVIWKIPLKDLGDYMAQELDFRAYEVVEDKIILERWPLEMADRYLDGTKYQDQLEGKKLYTPSSYAVDKDFFPKLFACMEADVPVLRSKEASKEGWSFDRLYLYKYHRKGSF